MHCGREGIVWELRNGKEKGKKKKKDFYWFVLYLQYCKLTL